MKRGSIFHVSTDKGNDYFELKFSEESLEFFKNPPSTDEATVWKILSFNFNEDFSKTEVCCTSEPE